jgi:hypothetical protein
MREGLQTKIEIDGGVTLENAGSIVKAGADVLVAGSTVFKAADPKEDDLTTEAYCLTRVYGEGPLFPTGCDLCAVPPGVPARVV